MDSILLASYMCFNDSINQIQNHIDNLGLQPFYSYDIAVPAKENYYNYIPIFSEKRNVPDSYVYFSQKKPSNKVISREIYDKNGNPKAVFKLNEVKHHNFILNCLISKKMPTDFLLNILLELLENIYDDTEYIIANINDKSLSLSKILIQIGFQEIETNKKYLLN